MKPDYRPPKSQMLSIATVKIRWDVALKSQRRALTGDILSWSDWVVPAVRNRRDGDEGEDHPPLHCLFDTLTIAAQESGTYRGRRQSRWLRTADGFAVWRPAYIRPRRDGAFAEAVFGSVELIVHPDAHDVVGEMCVCVVRPLFQ